MPTLSVAELAQACEGRLLRGNPDHRVTSFEIDTRRLQADSGFFALKGTRTDGHGFLGEAARMGAVAAVVHIDPGPDAPAPHNLILVDDTTEAMARAGGWVRRKLATTRWIAVTGSNGKTTTKEMIAESLGSEQRVHRTAGNFNNHLGVPLTLLACPEDTKVAVIELAMNAPGEIAMLAQMTDPDIGVVTNVRAVHLEYFDSLDDIAAAKGELFAVLRSQATSVVNLDDMHVRVQAARHDGPRVTFGQHAAADLKIYEIQNRFLPGSSFGFQFEGEKRHVQLRIGGAHSAFNALAALATVAAAGADMDRAVQQLEKVEAGAGRGRVHQLDREIQLVDDSYNCSPAALASVLDTVQLSESVGRKVMVLGDMLELGHLEDAMHREAGKRIAAAGVDVLFTVGSLARGAAEVARQAGVAEVHQHKNANDAASSVGEYLKPGDLVVVKGSRGVHLERVVQALVSGLGGTA